MGGMIVLVSALGVCGTLSMGYCCARISTSVTRDIRNQVFEKIQTFSRSEYNHFGISSLITRTNNDAFQIQLFVNVILDHISDPGDDRCQLFYDDAGIGRIVPDYSGNRSRDHSGHHCCGKNIETNFGKSAEMPWII